MLPTTITVTGTFLDGDGVPERGAIEFSSSVGVVSPGDNVIVSPVVRRATLDGSGAISIALFATDDPAWQPQGWTWQVSHQFRGGGSRQYSIELPHDLVGATVDLADLIPVQASSGSVTDAGVLAVNGDDGPYVVLTAAEVGAAPTDHEHAAEDITTGTVALVRLPVGTGSEHVAAGDHTHAGAGHEHDATYAPIAHNHDASYSATGHNHNSAYSALGHTHAGTDITSPGNGMTDWLNVRVYGAVGDGATDDTTAIQAALTAAYTEAGPVGRTVYLPAGMYRTSAPLVIPPYVTLLGSHANRGTNTQLSCIKPLSTFTGAAILSLLSQTVGGYGIASYGQRIMSLTLDGGAARAAGKTFSGVRAEGRVNGVVMVDLSITQASDRGVQTATDGTGQGPFSWHLSNVQVSDITLDGFRLSGATDTTLIGCRAIGVGRHGYHLDGLANSTFTACRSEWSGQHGWYITSNWGTGTGSGGALFQGCSTDRNTQNGFLIDATGSSPLVFNGLLLRRDGRNAKTGFGGYAGFHALNSTMPIIIDALNVFVGVDDDGTGQASPQHGFRAAGCTWVGVGSGYLHGFSSGYTDGLGNTALIRGTAVGTATGTTAAPVRA